MNKSELISAMAAEAQMSKADAKKAATVRFVVKDIEKKI